MESGEEDAKSKASVGQGTGTVKTSCALSFNNLTPADAAWASSGISPSFSLAQFLTQLLAFYHLGAGPGSSFALSLAHLRRNCRGRAEAGTSAREEMGRHIRRV